jgi:adenylylsulfate kinase
MALVFAAIVLTREGHDVVIDATANLRRWRDEARMRIKEFHEVFIKCPIELCRDREKTRVDKFAPRDVYKKGEAGWPVPGVNVPYEEPLSPELAIDCGTLTPEEAASVLVGYIKKVKH